MLIHSPEYPENKLKDQGNVQVLEVATREGNVSNNLDLAVTGVGDGDLVTEVADTALDLNAVVQELLEGRDVEDLVARGLRSVDDVLQHPLAIAFMVYIQVREPANIPSG